MLRCHEQCKQKQAQSLVEYALLLTIIALTVVGALAAIGGKAASTIGDAGDSFPGHDPEPDSYVHVAGIDLEARAEGHAFRVTATVTVQDQEGEAVGSATVAATYFVNGAEIESQSDETDGQGRARFSYRSDELSSGDVVRLGVTNVTASGYEYDSDSNVESSDQITIP